MKDGCKFALSSTAFHDAYPQNNACGDVVFLHLLYCHVLVLIDIPFDGFLSITIEETDGKEDNEKELEKSLHTNLFFKLATITSLF
jgi:hypothetical protein